MEKISDEIRNKLRQKIYKRFLKENPTVLILDEKISFETSLVLLNSMTHNAWKQLDSVPEERKKELEEEIAMYQNECKMLYKNINTEKIKNKICDVYSPILKAEFAEIKKNTK